MVIEDTVIVVELKFEDEKSLEKLLNLGLSQTHDNRYYEPFVNDYQINFL
ncbi:MAG: hypothetical protein LBD03_09630 [Methanobrevibacter sp.]|nr:hypothetical protein [Candidatus Methanovirga procula]